MPWIWTWPLSWIVVGVVLALLPAVIASVRRHHQLLAIWGLVLVPVLITVAGLVLVLGMHQPMGIPLAGIGLYIVPLPWFIALIWSLTAVRRFAVVARHDPRVVPGGTTPVRSLTEAEREERRSQRRSRGY